MIQISPEARKDAIASIKRYFEGSPSSWKKSDRSSTTAPWPTFKRDSRRECRNWKASSSFPSSSIGPKSTANGSVRVSPSSKQLGMATIRYPARN